MGLIIILYILRGFNFTPLCGNKAQQRLHFLRQLRKFNLPQELLIQFYSAIIESVLCTSITVWFGSATKSDLRRLQSVSRTAERIIGTTLPPLQELYLSRVSKKAVKITLDRTTSNTLPLWTVTVWSTLQSSEHQNDQTQEQFLPSSNPSHEHLTLNMEHTTLLYNYLFTTHAYLFLFLQICTCQTSHIIVCIVFCAFAILYIVYCSSVVCVLSCCCRSVALWSFCHYNKSLVCVNIPGQ